MNGCDLYHEVNLPHYFTLDHPVGSVMGRAEYGEGFSFGQNCTVGNNKGIYPVLGENVRMCANSSIIGNCRIGDNVIIGANSGVKDEDVPDNSIVFGYSPHLIIKDKRLKISVLFLPVAAVNVFRVRISKPLWASLLLHTPLRRLCRADFLTK